MLMALAIFQIFNESWNKNVIICTDSGTTTLRYRLENYTNCTILLPTFNSTVIPFQIPLTAKKYLCLNFFFNIFFIESFNKCTNHFTYNIKVHEIGLYLHNIDPKEVTFNIHYIFRST